MSPRYPFSPELLDALPEELCELFRGLERKLLEEIASRLRLSGRLNEVTLQDIRALRALGVDLEAIKQAVSQAAAIGMEKLEALLNETVARNQEYYAELATLARVTAPERMVGLEDTWSIFEQTRGEYRNLTRSMGFVVREGRRRVLLPPGRAYQWALDSAEVQVMSGAVSYSQAIAEAAWQLADSGLRVVNYESGHTDSVDVAVRRAVMTGVNQLNQKYREQSMDVLETDLVQVTAHRGARDTEGPYGWENHKRWQGRVYRWAKYTALYPESSAGDYPDFEETCGVGSVTGIGGANCRHSFHSFVEGVMEPTYTAGQLEHIDDGLGCEFEGRRYSAYEATQKQRQLERTIRKWKRRKAAAVTEEEKTAANIRLRRLNEEYRAFSKAAGLPEQRERMRVLYEDDAAKANAAALKLRQDAEEPIRAAIRRGDYPLTINPEKQARHMAGTAQSGRSVITVSQKELQEIVNAQAGRGRLELTKSLSWKSKEVVSVGKEIGYTINKNGDIIKAYSIKIHYSKTGVHCVPTLRGREK